MEPYLFAALSGITAAVLLDWYFRRKAAQQRRAEAERSPANSENPLLFVRIMRVVPEGAEPIWIMRVPALPAVGSFMVLVRTIQHMDGNPSPKSYVVTSHQWMIGAGWPPNTQDFVDVYVREEER